MFNGTDRGIRIKTRRGRGGEIHDLVFRNLVMKNNVCPVAINMYYKCGASPSETALFSPGICPVVIETPRIHSIVISNITATACRASAGFIVGLPESPIENLRIENSVFETDEDSGVPPEESEMYRGLPQTVLKSIRILNTLDPVFDNVSVRGPKESFSYT
jgi:polygalacturonase